MARTAMLTARVYPELKKRAETLFRSYGLSTSLVINALLSEIARSGEIPSYCLKGVTIYRISKKDLLAYTPSPRPQQEDDQEVDKKEDEVVLDPKDVVVYEIDDEEAWDPEDETSNQDNALKPIDKPDSPDAERPKDHRD